MVIVKLVFEVELSEKQISVILPDRVFAPVADHESDYAESAYGAQKPPVVAPSGSR